MTKSYDDKLDTLVSEATTELSYAKGNCDGSPTEWNDAHINSFLRLFML